MFCIEPPPQFTADVCFYGLLHKHYVWSELFIEPKVGKPEEVLQRRDS